MSQSGAPATKRRSRRQEPLKINMTVVVRTGEAPEDCITLMDDRELHMVGSVFKYKNRIQRFIGKAVFQVASKSPAMYRELMPGLVAIARGGFGGLRKGFK